MINKIKKRVELNTIVFVDKWVTTDGTEHNSEWSAKVHEEELLKDKLAPFRKYYDNEFIVFTKNADPNAISMVYDVKPILDCGFYIIEICRKLYGESRDNVDIYYEVATHKQLGQYFHGQISVLREGLTNLQDAMDKLGIKHYE